MIKSITQMTLKEVSFGHETPVLSNVNLDLRAGKFYWVRGESGGGKSTLLKLLAGLIEPLAGEFFVNSACVNDLTFEEFLPYRLNIGYSFDLGGLINNKTLWDNMMLPLLYHKIMTFEEAESRAASLFSQFQLDRYRNERPASVPGGIRKAACVARAFVLSPKILLLDEPFTGLNIEGAQALDNVMKNSNSEHMVFITSRSEDYVKDWTNAELHVGKDGIRVVERPLQVREAI